MDLSIDTTDEPTLFSVDVSLTKYAYGSFFYMKVIVLILIICLDLEHLRTIKSERHHRLAQEHGLLTYAVSAKARVAASFSH
jgi:hypothetical protein